MKPKKVAAWVGAVTGLGFLLWSFHKWKASDQKHSLADVSNWTEFVKGCRGFFDANEGCPMFHLIDELDELYRVAFTKALFQTDFLRQCFLICRKSLWSAAMATASGLPEDGAAITRRALEAAQTCLAIKADPKNLERWTNEKVRKDRWQSREKGERPPRLGLKYENIGGEPLYQDLQFQMGILSDFTVHFTPEHMRRFRWEKIQESDGTLDYAFGVDENAVANEFLMMALQHSLIMHVFDRCLDGKLLLDPAVRDAAERATGLYNALAAKEREHQGHTTPLENQ